MEKQLPNGWKSPKLDELIIFKLGGDWGKEPEFNDSDYVEVRCIRASELRNWSEEKGETAALRKIKKSSLAKRELQAGDILVEISGGGPEQPVGRTVLIDKSVLAKNAESKKVCTNFFRLIRPSCKVNAKYLNIFLQYFYASGKISEFQSGSNNLRNLKFNDYLQINIPLASEKEQKSIVAKIEELFSELDSGIASLKTAREQLKIYRQALLKHAFEGKLTEQWRKDNADKLETPEQLLARIQTERETRYQQQLNDWKQAVKEWEAKGKEGKRPSKPAVLKKPTTLKHLDLTVPTNWAVQELVDIASECVLGKMLDKQKNIGTERPYLGNINVRWGRFDLDDLKTMRIEDSEVERYSLIADDLVICEGGEPGRCAIWPKSSNQVFIQKALHRVRFTASYSSKFAFYYFTYAVPLERVIKLFTGTTIKHLTGAGLKKMQLPVCSINEQQEIVNQLEEKLSNVEKLEIDIEGQIAKAETLRQSILKKAFSGQLVLSDLNDGSASVKPARAKAEK